MDFVESGVLANARKAHGSCSSVSDRHCKKKFASDHTAYGLPATSKAMQRSYELVMHPKHCVNVDTDAQHYDTCGCQRLQVLTSH